MHRKILNAEGCIRNQPPGVLTNDEPSAQGVATENGAMLSNEEPLRSVHGVVIAYIPFQVMYPLLDVCPIKTRL